MPFTYILFLFMGAGWLLCEVQMVIFLNLYLLIMLILRLGLFHDIQIFWFQVFDGILAKILCLFCMVGVEIWLSSAHFCYVSYAWLRMPLRKGSTLGFKIDLVYLHFWLSFRFPHLAVKRADILIDWLKVIFDVVEGAGSEFYVG